MNICKCEPGTAVPASQYNKATACDKPACSLHTIIIPLSKGTDAPGQPNAPVLGGHQNAIVVYEASGSVYLFDEQGVYTNLTGSSIVPVIDQLRREMEATVQHVSTVDNKLAKEVIDRQHADVDMQALIDKLQAQLSTESAERQTNDTAFENKLNALEAKIAAGGGDVAAEAEAREQADNDLQGQITDLSDNLTAEEGAREAGDNALQTAVDNLQSSVEDLSGKVTSVTGKAANLPDELTQEVVVNTNEEGSSVSIQATQLDLTTGDTSTDASTIQFKTINNVSILGEGNIEIEGGGSDIEVLTNYNASATNNQVYCAPVINGRLDSDLVRLGSGTSINVNNANNPAGIAIGKNARAAGSKGVDFISVAIGWAASATGNYSTVVGANASSDNQDGVAIGHNSTTTRMNEFSIGRSNVLRYLANVKAGELDTDAVNLKQMKDYVDEHAGGDSIDAKYGKLDATSLSAANHIVARRYGPITLNPATSSPTLRQSVGVEFGVTFADVPSVTVSLEVPGLEASSLDNVPKAIISSTTTSKVTVMLGQYGTSDKTDCYLNIIAIGP